METATYKALDYFVHMFVVIPKASGRVCIRRLKKLSYTPLRCRKRQAILTSKPVMSQRCRWGSTEGGASIVVSEQSYHRVNKNSELWVIQLTRWNFLDDSACL